MRLLLGVFLRCTFISYLVPGIIFLKIRNNSCEVEDFFETHLYKLGVILRSRVLRVIYGLIPGIEVRI